MADTPLIRPVLVTNAVKNVTTGATDSINEAGISILDVFDYIGTGAEPADGTLRSRTNDVDGRAPLLLSGSGSPTVAGARGQVALLDGKVWECLGGLYWRRKPVEKKLRRMATYEFQSGIVVNGTTLIDMTGALPTTLTVGTHYHVCFKPIEVREAIEIESILLPVNVWNTGGTADRLYQRVGIFNSGVGAASGRLRDWTGLSFRIDARLADVAPSNASTSGNALYVTLRSEQSRTQILEPGFYHFGIFTGAVMKGTFRLDDGAIDRGNWGNNNDSRGNRTATALGTLASLPGAPTSLDAFDLSQVLITPATAGHAGVSDFYGVPFGPTQSNWDWSKVMYEILGRKVS